MRLQRVWLSSLIFLGFAAGAGASAQAAGFYIQEQSVSGLGRAFAGSAAHPSDSSTVYTNPAGMTYLDKAQGQAGINLLHPRSDFSDQGSTTSTTLSGGTVAVSNSGDGGNPYSAVSPVPNLFVVQPIADSGAWIGFGVTAPFGLSNEYEEGWFGRYDSTSSDLAVLDFSPAVAFRASERFSFGFGVNVQHVDADLRRAVPDPLAAGGPTAATDGELILEGDSTAVGVNAGVIYEPWERTRIGAHYRSEVNHRLDGALKGVTPAGIGGGVSFRSPGNADLDLPQMATLAAAHDLSERLSVLAHAIWFGWGSFRQIHMELDNGGSLVDAQEYENSMAVAVGAEYKASEAWTLRAGVQYDETPTTGDNRTTRTPDGNRTWVSGGASYEVSEKVTLDLAATYIFIDEGHVDRTASFDALYGMFGAGGASATVNTVGTTESSVGILGLAVNYRF